MEGLFVAGLFVVGVFVIFGHSLFPTGGGVAPRFVVFGLKVRNVFLVEERVVGVLMLGCGFGGWFGALR